MFKKITITEAKIVDARIKGCSLSQIVADKLLGKINLLVFKIVSISGASLPPTEEYAMILANELMIFLLEHGFGYLTEEEILLAFRFNALGVRVDGEVERVVFRGIMNVTQAAMVLENYIVLRNQLDRKLQNHIDGY